MLTKILLIVVTTLFVAKFVLRVRFRELGRRLDRAVTLILVLIVVTYGVYLARRLLEG